MTMISGNSYWSNSNSYSGVFGSTGTSSGGLLGIDLSEYYSITKGSYRKLLKQYYNKYGTDKKSSDKSTSKTDSKETTLAKTNMKGNANELYKAANALVTTGKDSVFKKVDIKNEEDGTTTKGYDTDKIYKAVNNLVEAYNKYVKGSTDSTNNAVLRQTLHMINSVSSNGKILGNMGIKIGADNTLSIDEEKFKEADMDVVKSLFNGSGSLGSSIQTAASSVYMNVQNSLGDSSSYTASGSFGNYSTGNILDSFF
ncbi:MAG: flagellar filament capping protein FliD [Clostridium sp.]|nr:flagellar filament capping protein FliD [Clostridium sp.]